LRLLSPEGAKLIITPLSPRTRPQKIKFKNLSGYVIFYSYIYHAREAVAVAVALNNFLKDSTHPLYII